MIATSKTCPNCHRTLDIEMFTPSTTSNDGYHCYCKNCRAEKQRARYIKMKIQDPNFAENTRQAQAKYRDTKKNDQVWVEKYKEKYKNYGYKKKYGITLIEKELMLISQNNQCLICEKEMKLNNNCHVDHNHETSKVRGLLCGRCNGGLGYIEDTNFLNKAKGYLKNYEIITA